MAVDVSGAVETVSTVLLWLCSRDQVEFHNTFVEPSGHQWHDQSPLQTNAQPSHISSCTSLVTSKSQLHNGSVKWIDPVGYAFAAVVARHRCHMGIL